MILSNLRASAWKYAALVCAVLAVAALVAALFFRGSEAASRVRAVAAEQRAQALAGELAAAKAAAKRDDLSADATQDARNSADARQKAAQDRADRMGKIANEPRPPVPDGCPGPDARVLRESQDATARISAAEDRLRGYGRSASRTPN